MEMGACVCYFVFLVVLRVIVGSSAYRSAANASLWNCRRQQTYISVNGSLSACHYVVATCAGCPMHVTCALRSGIISWMKTRTAWEMRVVGADC
jgi:hypothetical protein